VSILHRIRACGTNYPQLGSSGLWHSSADWYVQSQLGGWMLGSQFGVAVTSGVHVGTHAPPLARFPDQSQRGCRTEKKKNQTLTHAHAHKHTQLHTHMHTHVRICIHTYKCIHKHAQADTLYNVATRYDSDSPTCITQTHTSQRAVTGHCPCACLLSKSSTHRHTHTNANMYAT
jgi:hypothetical protein